MKTAITGVLLGLGLAVGLLSESSFAAPDLGGRPAPASAVSWQTDLGAPRGGSSAAGNRPGGSARTRITVQLKGAERLMGVRSARETPRSPMNPSAPLRAPAPIRIQIFKYHGWERSLAIENGTVEAIVVPAIGRVMQFRFLGQPGPFWEDPALHGRAVDATSTEWGNFGGDKTWPAPQSDWPKVTARGWPPPVAFDSMPVDASIRRDSIVLRSPVDPHYGIRTERVISLDPKEAVMRIVTVYEKVEGDPVEVGVWIITQLEDPVAVYALLPSPSLFPEGFNRQSGDTLPAQLKVDGNLVSLRRDPAKATKIGTDASQLLWMGKDQLLVIESPRLSAEHARYPDQQSSAEIYTNPDPKTYVELEMLGPLRKLAPGDTLSQTNTYRLLPRSNADPATEARRAMQLR